MGQRYSALIALGNNGPIVTSALEEAVLCKCSCCTEAINMLSHRRKANGACSCKDYVEVEQCDCDFCAIVLKKNPLEAK